MNTPNLMDIEKIKELIRKNMEHPYMERHIPAPVIDEDKLILIMSLLQNSSLSAETKIKYVITTMLVQIALDTHELVPEFNQLDESNQEKLEKQLHVLAGDYFSGLYYYLLADIGEIEFIHTLATAIADINEYKMKLYYQDIQSLNEYVQVIKNIESLLSYHISNFLGDQTIQPISEELLSMKRLVKEKQRVKNGFSSTLTPWMEKEERNPNELDMIMRRKIDFLENMISQLPNQYMLLKNHIRQNIKDYTSVMEEG